MNSTIGSSIHLKVMESSGEIIDYGVFTNHPNDIWMGSSSYMRGFVANTWVSLLSSSTIKALSGTWTQTDKTISRVTGTDTLGAASRIYKFSDGTFGGWRTSGTTTSITVSKSNTVSAQKLYEYNAGVNGSGYQSILNIPTSLKYNGSGSLITESQSAQFPPAGAPYTLRNIYQGPAGYNNGYGTQIVIDPPVDVNIGDRVIIDKFSYVFAYSTYQPVTFSVSPIGGITGTGRIQRLRKISVYETSDTISRIYLLSDANKITIPNMLGPLSSVLNPGSYTPIETIVATNTHIAPTASNDFTESATAYGSTAVGGQVKQILWGNPTEFFGVIEYDTPVTIASGKTLTVGLSTQYNINPSLPTTF